MDSVDDEDDFGACHPWAAGFEAQLDAFRQGNIIDGLPAFFLQSDQQLWSRPRQEFSGAPHVLVGENGHPPRHAMLLTQACDMMKRNNPWISLAPVYDASDRLVPGQHGQVKSGQFGHLIYISAAWAANGLWVADLRLEMPVEKTILSDREPIEAFANEVEYADLAQRLGARRQRLAAPQSCLDLVVSPLFDTLRALPDGGSALNLPVYELRVHWNDPIDPTVVTVYVVAPNEASRAEVDVDGWSTVVLSLYEAAAAAGITVVGPEITSMEDMSAADYIQSAPIHDTLSS